MKFKDYYQVLGVAREATADEIKRAYRKLARRFHPDVSEEANAEERFKEVNEAYEALKDPKRRAAYDQLGTHWRPGDDFDPPPGWGASRDADNFGFSDESLRNFGDFFESIFGRNAHSPGAGAHEHFRMRGGDQHAIATIDLHDSYRGVEQLIDLQLSEGVTKRLKFKVPKGVTEGQQIRLQGQGMPGYGGEPAGHLYLQVRFKPNARFRADGKNIHTELPLAPWEAALGAEVEAPTLGGPVTLKIKPGTQTGQKLRLTGRGLPGTTVGDQIIELSVKVPPVDTPEKRQAFESLRELMDFDPRA